MASWLVTTIFFTFVILSRCFSRNISIFMLVRDSSRHYFIRSLLLSQILSQSNHRCPLFWAAAEIPDLWGYCVIDCQIRPAGLDAVVVLEVLPIRPIWTMSCALLISCLRLCMLVLNFSDMQTCTSYNWKCEICKIRFGPSWYVNGWVAIKPKSHPIKTTYSYMSWPKRIWIL